MQQQQGAGVRLHPRQHAQQLPDPVALGVEAQHQRRLAQFGLPQRLAQHGQAFLIGADGLGQRRHPVARLGCGFQRRYCLGQGRRCRRGLFGHAVRPGRRGHQQQGKGGGAEPHASRLCRSSQPVAAGPSGPAAWAPDRQPPPIAQPRTRRPADQDHRHRFHSMRRMRPARHPGPPSPRNCHGRRRSPSRRPPLQRGHRAGQARVHGLYRLDRGGQAAGVAHHVGVGIVHHDQVIAFRWPARNGR